MNKEIKSYLDKEYSAIYSGMNVSWQIGLKNKNEELIHKGLDRSGVAQTMLTSFATNLLKETTEKIEKLLEKVQNEFSFTMSKAEIKEYIDMSISNNNSYIDMFYKDLEDYFKKKGVSLTAGSIEITFNNAKGNSKHNLKRIEERLVLINEGQTQNSKKSKKENKSLSLSDWIAIIGIIIGILIAILL